MNFLDFCDWAAFTLGIIGLPLSIIDVFFNRTKQRIEEFIDALEDTFESLGEKYTKNHYYEWLFVIAVPSIIFILYSILAHYSPKLDSPPALAVYITVFLTMPALMGVTFYFISGTIKTMNSITHGKAFVSLGLILMLLGAFFDTSDKIISALEAEDKSMEMTYKIGGENVKSILEWQVQDNLYATLMGISPEIVLHHGDTIVSSGNEGIPENIIVGIVDDSRLKNRKSKQEEPYQARIKLITGFSPPNQTFATNLLFKASE